MSVSKTAQEAIREFVDLLAEQFCEQRNGSRDGKPAAVATDEFVSAIEHDLDAALRDRLSKLDTVKESEFAATVALSDADLARSVLPSQPNREHARSDDSGELSGLATDPQPSDGLEPTTNLDLRAAEGDTRRGQEFEVETVTLDTGNVPGESGDRSAAAREGSSRSLGDFTYDRPTLDSEVPTASKRSHDATGRPGPDIPDDYEIISVLGRGGMGVVYKARHRPLNRLVAIKMILQGANASESQLNRFQREAEAAAHLSHPNIVSIYEVGRHKSLPYFSLEYIEGRELSDLMKQQTLSAQDAAKLLIPVARAVHYSHQKGVLHRDLKPQNILLTQAGVPKVTDFGLAKRLDEDDDPDKELTREGMIVGTPGYMAPEQASGNPVGPSTDVYALGSILYYMITGRPPFTAPTPLETVRKLLDQDPVSPSKLQTDLDKDVETICLKSLEKDPKNRYQTAEEFADELQRFVSGQPIHARPITRRERLWKWCKRNPVVATLSGIAGGLLLCLLFGGMISAFVINEQKKAEQEAKRQAEDNAKLSHDTTRLVLYDTKDFFNSNPELQPLRASLMKQIIDRLEQHYLVQTQENPSAVFAASADRHLGQIYVDAGEFEKAITKLESAQQALQKLAADGKVANAASSQTHITLGLGDANYGLGEIKKAEGFYRELERQCLSHRPDELPFDMVPLATAYGKLGKVYRALGNPHKSEEYILKAERLHRKEYEEDPQSLTAIENLSFVLGDMGQMYERAGDTERMLKCTREAIKLKMQLPAAGYTSARRHNLARDQKNLAQQYLVANQEQEARELLQTAANTVDDLLKTSDDARMQSLARNVYYLQGITLGRLGEETGESFQRAEEIQRKLLAKSDNMTSRGELLKILARAGQVDEALKLADRLAADSDKLMNCGYAACGYALVAKHLPEDDPRRSEITAKAIELTQKLIRHGYHDFHSLRATDLDFEPLQENQAYLKMLEEEEQRIANNQTKEE